MFHFPVLKWRGKKKISLLKVVYKGTGIVVVTSKFKKLLYRENHLLYVGMVDSLWIDPYYTCKSKEQGTVPLQWDLIRFYNKQS